MPLKLAKFVGLHEAASLLASVQKTLCTRLFPEPNPDRINFPLEFLLREGYAISLASDAEVRYADCLTLLCYLSPTIEPLKTEFGSRNHCTQSVDVVESLRARNFRP